MVLNKIQLRPGLVVASIRGELVVTSQRAHVGTLEPRREKVVWKDVIALAEEHPASVKEAAEVYAALAKGTKARSYADENFPPAAVRLVGKKGGRVQAAVQVGMLGRDDNAHAAYARDNKLILLTCDRDFLNQTKFPLNQSPATYVLNFGDGPAGEMALLLRCPHLPLAAPEFLDKWIQVDASVHEWTERARFMDGTTSRTRYRFHLGRMQEWVASE
jgi:predicted nuclease of predicted toxin-antitoxin system